jgi:hypothetical protein
VRGALFTAVVAKVISCSFAGREIRRVGFCGVCPADEARLLREQPLRTVLNDTMFHAGVVGVRHVPVPSLVGWWTPPAAAGKKRGCLLRGHRELALLDACQTAPTALAR